ncbi:MAG: long-chain-fatty-acid--CoA ligase [Planctomycetota bacterium]|jgi:fatty-acyl-CoA synthase
MAAYNFQLLLKFLLEHGVAWAPNQEIIYRDQVRYTYKRMYLRVLELASALQSIDVVKGTMVGVMEWDSHRYLEMYFGIPGLGAVLHTINPRLAVENIIYTMQKAEDEALIFHEDFLPLVKQIRQRIGSVKKYILISDKGETPDVQVVDAEYEQMLKDVSPLDELPDLDENSQATLSFTSGTTGNPKGVCFTHRQLVLHTLSGWSSAAILGNYGGLDKHDVYMPLTPMFHAHAWGVPYWATLYGLKQVYPGKYDPGQIVKLAIDEKVTFSHCVPTIVQMVVDVAEANDLDFGGWKIITGGARLPKGLAISASKWGIKLTGGYGLSESCPFIVLANLKPFMEEDWDQNQQLDVSVKTGFTMPLVKARVVTPEGQDVPPDGNTTGEIVLRCPWLTPGYYKDSENSEKLWEGGWMHTGDVANIDEHGYLQIVDRLKNIIKSGGEWIVSMEIENMLSLHEDVKESALIGIPDEKWGERSLAIIVPQQDAHDRITADAIKKHLMKFVDDGVIAGPLCFCRRNAQNECG